MRERPILFSAPMVRALLAGTKTQTRRFITPQPFEDGELVGHAKLAGLFGAHVFGPCLVSLAGSPYGTVGDQLWVRETHAKFSVGDGLDRPVPECIAYRATCAEDGTFDYVNGRGEILGLKVTKWTPAIFMPRWASRINLAIMRVRVERLEDITESDARAEGVSSGRIPADDYGPERIGYVLGPDDGKCTLYPTEREAFAAGWDQINGERASWTSNPWVWVVEFTRVELDPKRSCTSSPVMEQFA